MPDSPLITIDDKHVPLYRIVWVSDIPHFCGEDDCTREGQYEIRLDVDDSLWTGASERDSILATLKSWLKDPRADDETEW